MQGAWPQKPCAAAVRPQMGPSMVQPDHERRRRHRRRPAGQSLQGRPAGRRHVRFHCRRLDHRPSWRQRRRQNHDHRDDHGARDADIRTVRVLGVGHAAPALPRAAPDEFRKPLCRHADAPDRAAESARLRQLYAVADVDGRIARSPTSSISPNFSTGRPASYRPDRRRACRSPSRCSTSRRCCCSMSRPPRSIPTPPIGCAGSSSAIAGSAPNRQWDRQGSRLIGKRVVRTGAAGICASETRVLYPGHNFGGTKTRVSLRGNPCWTHGRPAAGSSRPPRSIPTPPIRCAPRQ